MKKLKIENRISILNIIISALIPLIVCGITIFYTSKTTNNLRIDLNEIKSQKLDTEKLTVSSNTGNPLMQVSSDGIWKIGKDGASTNLFQFNTASGTVDILGGLNFGSLQSPSNPGQFVFYNIPINASSVAGTAHSGTFAIDSNNLMTWYGQSDGKGSVKNLMVGIGTTTPTVKLDVNGIIRTQPQYKTTCDIKIIGSIYYDKNENHFYGCNGLNWNKLDN